MAKRDHKAGVKNALSNFYKHQAKKLDVIEEEARARTNPPRIKLKAAKYADNPLEVNEQIKLASFIDRHLPVLWNHCPNEANVSPRQGRRMNAQGRKRGVPDCMIYHPNPKTNQPVAIELKRRKGGRVTEDQQYWLDTLEAIGWKVAVCRGADEAIDLLKELWGL